MKSVVVHCIPHMNMGTQIWPEEKDHLDLPGSKLSNSFENIFVEKLYISG
jgi:hypothetical protein